VVHRPSKKKSKGKKILKYPSRNEVFSASLHAMKALGGEEI
jgi:hypothetical protein